MHRTPFDLVRLFLSLFQDLPPMSRSLYLPGAVLLVGYPVLSVAFGPDHSRCGFGLCFRYDPARYGSLSARAGDIRP